MAVNMDVLPAVVMSALIMRIASLIMGVVLMRLEAPGRAQAPFVTPALCNSVYNARVYGRSELTTPLHHMHMPMHDLSCPTDMLDASMSLCSMVETLRMRLCPSSHIPFLKGMKMPKNFSMYEGITIFLGFVRMPSV